MSGVPERLFVVPRRSDPDVVRTLYALLEMAERGEIIGLAYVALKPGHAYQGDSIGAALQHPVMALGIAKALEVEIAALIR